MVPTIANNRPFRRFRNVLQKNSFKCLFLGLKWWYKYDIMLKRKLEISATHRYIIHGYTKKNVVLVQCFWMVPGTKKRDTIFRLGNRPRVHLLLNSFATKKHVLRIPIFGWLPVQANYTRCLKSQADLTRANAEQKFGEKQKQNKNRF